LARPGLEFRHGAGDRPFVREDAVDGLF